MKIEQWNIDKLIDYASNPRKNDKAVDKVAAAIREFGFRVPIIARSNGTIVDGHLRLKAAKKLGMPQVPVVLADDLSEAQVKAFRISVNKMADLADWDVELLGIEIDHLKELDYDIDLIGFDDDELAGFGIGVNEVDLPELNSGDKEPFQQMTFTLHDDQVEQVTAAIDKSKAMGEPVDTKNENSNGNALARICEIFNGIS
jgi:ParB-like chromosome segregation protein Spo0J